VKRFFSLLVILFVTPQLVQAQGVSPRFGVIESYEATDAATALGVGWTRVRFPWAEVQPNDADEWIPKVADELISAEINKNRQVVGLLIGIPQWARDSADLPQGLYLPHNDPANLWANYVREAVTRYPDIKHWVIWNEPDIWDENALGYTWHGDEADFAQLMRVGYLTAKEVNPEVVIHLSAMTFFWDNNFGRTQYLDRLLAELAKDPAAPANNYYFDVATAHLYFQPNQLLSILEIWRGILDRYGLVDKPWWLMETNAPVSDDPTWPVDEPTLAVSQMDQANYIGQAIAVALTVGVERVAIYKLIDTESDRMANPEPFGLVRADGEKRVGFWAYRAVIDLFDDVVNAERLRWDSVGHIRLMHPDGVTDILFARGQTAELIDVTCRRACQSAELRDTFGNRLLVEPIAGFFRIELPASPCTQRIGDGCMIGGNTYYLVQRDPVIATITPTLTLPPNEVASATPVVQLTVTPESPVRAPVEPPPSPTLEIASAFEPTATPHATITGNVSEFDNTVVVVVFGILINLTAVFIVMRNYVK
jgi:hypothetical protein